MLILILKAKGRPDDDMNDTLEVHVVHAVNIYPQSFRGERG